MERSNPALGLATNIRASSQHAVAGSAQTCATESCCPPHFRSKKWYRGDQHSVLTAHGSPNSRADQLGAKGASDRNPKLATEYRLVAACFCWLGVSQFGLRAAFTRCPVSTPRAPPQRTARRVRRTVILFPADHYRRIIAGVFSGRGWSLVAEGAVARRVSVSVFCHGAPERTDP